MFKDPLGAYRTYTGPLPPDGIPFQQVHGYNGAVGQGGAISSHTANQAALPAIAPRPSFTNDSVGSLQTGPSQALPGDGYAPFGYEYDTQPQHAHVPSHSHRGSMSQNRTMSIPSTGYPPTNQGDTRSHAQLLRNSTTGSDSGIDLTYPGQQSRWSHSSGGSNDQPGSLVDQSRHGSGPQAVDLDLDVRNGHRSSGQYQDPRVAHMQQWAALSARLPQAPISGDLATPATYETYRNDVVDSQTQGPATSNHDLIRITDDSPILVNAPHGPNSYMHDAQFSGLVPMEPNPSMEPDEDFWDIDSDDDNMAVDNQITDASTHDLGMMLAISANRSDRHYRTLTNFLHVPNVLSTYHPQYNASPLMDPATARVFCHFVTATAPTLSVYERHPANPSLMFSGAPIHVSQRSLWTYTLPMMALSHQGLLHAMLAMGSLHIAKLQQSSTTTSLKHYHYALRRVGKALTQPSKRQNVATLAATLLLGFYEVTTAEHNKWNSHLLGARELIMDIDFATMSKRIRAHNAQVRMSKKNGQLEDFSANFETVFPQRKPSGEFFLENSEDLDDTFVSDLMGREIKLNQDGSKGEEPSTPTSRPLTPKEIETYRGQCDLYWWYAKQDMYQSIISGNRLL